MHNVNEPYDFRKSVVYQIYPKSFRDSDGDGFGDIGGVVEKLDYIKALGVDCIWLTPFFVSPQRDNGYDVADYYNIDPRYGTMEDVERLIAEAEARGIGVMLDMVFNHVSTDHEWFRKAMEGMSSSWWRTSMAGTMHGRGRRTSRDSAAYWATILRQQTAAMRGTPWRFVHMRRVSGIADTRVRNRACWRGRIGMTVVPRQHVGTTWNRASPVRIGTGRWQSLTHRYDMSGFSKGQYRCTFTRKRPRPSTRS